MKVYLDGVLPVSPAVKETIIANLKIDYYDPSGEGNDFKAYKKNQQEKQQCDLYLHLITPKMKGFQEVINVVHDSNKKASKTIYCFLPEDSGNKFSQHQIKSLQAIGEMVRKNGAKWFDSVDEAINFINNPEKIT